MKTTNTTHPLRILHVVPSVDPAQGGVAESIRARGVKLLEMGHHVEVVSQDAPTAPSIANYPLTLHALGHGYTSWNYHPKLIPWLKQNSPRFDAVVVDGIWQYQCYAVRKALQGSKVPYFVFPHGMLDPWFKQTYPLKHLKKWLFWPWCEYLLLKHAEGVLFTCEEERRLAKESFWLYKANEQVVAFGTAAPPANGNELASAFLKQYMQLNGKRMLLFLGRLHPKKGCQELLEAFAKAQCPSDVVLGMAGPGETAYVAQLKNLAKQLGIENRVIWFGMLNGMDKWSALYACQTFVLPSHQENFGIAVAEALACGKPVLISDKVNIWQEIDNAKAGLVHEDNVYSTTTALRDWLSLTPAKLHEMSTNSRQLYLSHFSVEAMANALIECAWAGKTAMTRKS